MLTLVSFMDRTIGVSKHQDVNAIEVMFALIQIKQQEQQTKVLI